jgi:LPXTG-motif cell wall-anchored protein
VLVIFCSVALMFWWSARSFGPVVDGMPTTRDQPTGPVFLGVGGLVFGVGLLIFWRRRKSDSVRDN